MGLGFFIVIEASHSVSLYVYRGKSDGVVAVSWNWLCGISCDVVVAMVNAKVVSNGQQSPPPLLPSNFDTRLGWAFSKTLEMSALLRTQDS